MKRSSKISNRQSKPVMIGAAGQSTKIFFLQFRRCPERYTHIAKEVSTTIAELIGIAIN